MKRERQRVKAKETKRGDKDRGLLKDRERERQGHTQRERQGHTQRDRNIKRRLEYLTKQREMAVVNVGTVKLDNIRQLQF